LNESTGQYYAIGKNNLYSAYKDVYNDIYLDKNEEFNNISVV
jgi:hypothetical protein